jgi:hypothetical protein
MLCFFLGAWISFTCVNKKIWSVVLLAFLLIGLLSGCRIFPQRIHTNEVTNDTLWMNRELTTIVNRQYRDSRLGSHSLGGGYDPVVKNEWILDRHPFPNKAYQQVRSKFYTSEIAGDQKQMFRSIDGSDLLLHQFVGMSSMMVGQFALFDPNKEKDISALFPRTSSVAVFNRSRTKCLTLVNGEATVLDVLSATNDRPNASPRLSWAVPLRRLANMGFFAHLSEDTSCLFLLSRAYPSPPAGIEVWSTNQNLHSTIPTKQSGSQVENIDSVNGEILLLARQRTLLTNSWQWQHSLKILSLSGETKCSTNILSRDGRLYWDPVRREVFVPPKNIWDYPSP